MPDIPLNTRLIDDKKHVDDFQRRNFIGNKYSNRTESGDRFIPSRHSMSIDSANFFINSKEEVKDIFSQDPEEPSSLWYNRIGSDKFSTGHLYKFSINQEKYIKKAPNKPEICNPWPIRKSALLHRPGNLHPDHIYANVFFISKDMNTIDWSSSGYFGASLGSFVYTWNPYTTARDTFAEYHDRDSSTSVKWHPDGETIVLGSLSGSIKVCDFIAKKTVLDGDCLCEKEGVPCSITSLAWHPVQTFGLAMGCSRGVVSALDVKNCSDGTITMCGYNKVFTGSIATLRFSPSQGQLGKFLAVGGRSGRICVLLWPTLVTYLKITLDSPCRAIAWHPWKPSLLAVGTAAGNGSIHLVNVMTEKVIQSYQPSVVCSSCCLEWCPTSGLLLSSYIISPKSTKILVLSSFDKVEQKIEGNFGRILYLLWSPDKSQIDHKLCFLATAGSDETLRIWSLTKRPLLKRKGGKKMDKDDADIIRKEGSLGQDRIFTTQPASKWTMRIGTWNIETINGKEVELVEEMEKYRLEILGLSEVKKKGNVKIQLEKGYVPPYSGVSPGKRAKEGVGVILNSQILEKEEFYAQSQRTVDAENEECRQVILMGDFNGRTGNNTLRAHGCMGPYGREREGNSLFPHKRIHKITFEPEGRAAKSIIYYIIFSRPLRNTIMEVKVIQGAEVGMGHRLLIANTRIKEQSREKHKKVEKIQVKQLADPKIKKKYEELTEQKLNHFKITDDTELNDLWKNLKNIVIETADKKGILDEWRRYYEKTFSDINRTDLTYSSPKQEGGKKEIIITQGEVQEAIKEIRICKAAGCNEIAPELIKFGGKNMIQIIRKIFQYACRTTIPDDWKTNIIVPIFKKRNNKEYKNHRPICLSSVIYKLYTRILEKKLRKVIKNKLEEEQAAFRPGRQTQDHIFTLRTLIGKIIEKNRELYLAFLDLRAVFDSVPRKYLWESMIKKKVPYQLIKVIKSLHDGVKGLYKNEELEQVDGYEYLGTIITSDGRYNEEILNRKR
ncbi:hypothetical protein J437_LFUL008411 [Ladona fulva]|uniref:Reverse transcriptase domain-containing protein n=1 Tax=Ladona fulva TaxID=123851 RepID=A0A8K0P1C6_LADFU|nr:hypothetical protein J437_LFUL008411 [Ladona fulva]